MMDLEMEMVRPKKGRGKKLPCKILHFLVFNEHNIRVHGGKSMWTPEDFSKIWLEPEASHSGVQSMVILGHPAKMAARALSRRSAEDSQKSLTYAHTLFEKSTSKTFKKNGVSRWTPQEATKKTLLRVWSLQKCTWMSHGITAITDGTIHSHVHRDILQENHKHVKWSSTEGGRCNRTLTRRRKATTEMLQQKKMRLLEWPRVPTSRCCGETQQSSWENEWTETVL